MTTPNYPYGEPGNTEGNNQGFGGGQDNPGSYPSEPAGAGQFSAGYPTGGGTGYPTGGYQDPYNPGYTGGFENSPMNALKNKTAAWALGLGIASILSLLIMLIPVVGLIGLLAPAIAVAGIIVAIVALVKGKNYQGANKRTAWSIGGLVMSILTLVLIAVVIIVAVVFISDSGIIDCVTNNTDPVVQQACMEDAMGF